MATYPLRLPTTQHLFENLILLFGNFHINYWLTPHRVFDAPRCYQGIFSSPAARLVSWFPLSEDEEAPAILPFNGTARMRGGLDTILTESHFSAAFIALCFHIKL